MKECKCGCSELIQERNKNGDLFYVRGHHRKDKKFKNEKRNQKGENNNAWKGGRLKDYAGYIIVRCEGHPRAKGKGQYVFEHVLIMEKYLGRYLRMDEVVHHINKIKNDNRIKNLQLLTKSQHSSFHRKQDITTGKLIINGYKTVQWKK